MDWADAVASHLAGEDGRVDAAHVAQALREAKADGLRRARIAVWETLNPVLFELEDSAKAIEKGIK